MVLVFMLEEEMEVLTQQGVLLEVGRVVPVVEMVEVLLLILVLVVVVVVMEMDRTLLVVLVEVEF
jgi:hypothetical protein